MQNALDASINSGIHAHPTISPRAKLRDFSPDGYARNKQDQADHEEKKEQKLRDARRCGRNAGKSEKSRDQRDDEKNDSPTQHNDYLQ
jgi:hypothetical protein